MLHQSHSQTLPVLLALVCPGCGQETPDPAAEPGSTRDVVVIETRDGRTFTNIQHARLMASQVGTKEQVYLNVSGVDNAESWTFHARTSMEDLLDGSIEGRVVQQSRLASGSATVELQQRWANEGSFHISLKDGVAKGVVEARPSDFSASFEGRLVVVCSYWPDDSELSESGELVLDSDLSSAFCRPLRVIARD